jgi:diguanylate cyclase (GGDEF)-like protein
MRKHIPFIFLLFVLLVIAGSSEAIERKKKILVLHSYHQGLEWTDNITKGVKSVFDPLHDLYEIHYEYLDTKRNVDKQYIEEVARFVTQKNRTIQYEAVIVSDNNALTLLNQGSLRFTDNPPIIFCGINNYTEKLIENIEHVTGIAETPDLKGTIELISTLHHDPEHILVVLDRTATGNAIRDDFRKIEDEYKEKTSFEFLRDFSLDEIPAILSDHRHDDVIYILTFNRDKNGNFISYAEGIEMLSKHSKLPIYGSWDFYLGKGIVGGSITSGFLQGSEAAKYALRVLQGYDANRIEVLRESPAQFMFDYPVVQEFGIEENLLPKGSQIINAPPTTYEKYKNFLIAVTGIAISIALVLFWKYQQQRVLLNEKKALAIELEEKVKERTLELEQANQKLLELSNIDELTQLHNRRHFDRILLKEIRRAQRSSLPISLLMCDIDYFKRYNDTYGHLAGDECLKIVAHTIQESCNRASDFIARYGGEEFAIILPNTSTEKAVDHAEAIRKKLEEKHIKHEKSGIKNIVSMSIGIVSMVPDKETTPCSLISAADLALYDSKAAGRDQVALFVTQ